LRFTEGDGVLVGALGRSGDRVGRAFPLAVFAQVSGPGVGAAFPVLPAFAGRFLEAVESLLADTRSLPGADARSLPGAGAGSPPGAGARSLPLAGVSSLSLAGVVERVRALPLPGAGEAAAAEAWAGDVASRSPARELLAQVSGADGRQAVCVFHAFRTACHAARGREPVRGAAAVDCPVGGEVDVYAWLELARRALGRSFPPSFFWREGASPRLVISLGPPPAAVVAHLLTPGADHPRIRPLLSREPGDAATARRALGPRLVAALDSADVTVGELAAAFSPWDRT
jgi:type VI secretion system protein ImpM